MKYSFFLLFLLLISCSSVEDRIRDYSYTDYWYFKSGQRYQVYKTKRGNYYIIILNKNETKMVREYVQIQNQ